MTRNQIEFGKLKETMRANRENERLTGLRDERAHYVNLGQLSETGRHNLATESQARASLDESRRASMAIETIRNAELTEKSRSARATEALRQAELSESQRHNVASETISSAHEAEMARHNVETEREAHRSNIQQEGLKARQISLDYSAQMASVAQRRDASQLQAAVDRERISESRRSAVANEELQRQQINVTSARDTETKRSNLAKEAELLRSHTVTEAEIARHNREEERIKEKHYGASDLAGYINAGSNAVSAASRAASTLAGSTNGMGSAISLWGY